MTMAKKTPLALWKVNVVVCGQDGRNENYLYVGAKTASDAALLALRFEKECGTGTGTESNTVFVQQILRIHDAIIADPRCFVNESLQLESAMTTLEWWKMSVDVLGLSTRVRNALFRSGVDTLEQIPDCLSGDRLVNQIGPTSLSEIHRKFNKFMQALQEDGDKTELGV